MRFIYFYYSIATRDLMGKIDKIRIKKAYKYENTYHKIESLLISLNEMIMDYDIILIMTNKDSQKFIKPILKYIEK